ncbi:MAG: hypothetical protein AAF568_04140, partial [Pseudomonadota bacterium]
SAQEIAIAFVHEWVFNYGPPDTLLADNGKCFASKFFQSVCQILNVKNQFTTTYHPQTNGQVERFNRTLKAALKAYLDDHPNDWDLYYTMAMTTGRVRSADQHRAGLAAAGFVEIRQHPVRHPFVTSVLSARKPA